MKNVYLRSMLAAACAATLAACGGSGGNMYLSGSVIGLAKTGLILQNGGEELPVTAGSSSFVFVNLIKSEDRYDIKIKQQPKGATCTMTNGSGKANSYSVSTAYVSCITDTYPLSGSITGLNASGLTLVNGISGSISPLQGASTFTFPAVADGSTYNLSISSQPAGLTCKFQGSTSPDGHDIVGVMGSGPVSSLALNCAPK